MKALVALLCCVAATAHAQEGDDGPSDGVLVGAGLAMVVPTYFVGVTVHEGSHALAARLVGAEVIDLRLYPGRNPVNGAFQFGWARIRGIQSDRERLFFLAAPRIPDVLLLGGYGALAFTDHLPDDRWGLLVLNVLATGFWVDFSKDVLVFNRHNDVVRIYTILGLDTEWKRLPARLVHAAASAGLAYVVWQGWEKLFFAENDGATSPLVAPVFTTTF